MPRNNPTTRQMSHVKDLFTSQRSTRRHIDHCSGKGADLAAGTYNLHVSDATVFGGRAARILGAPRTLALAIPS
eukprot:3091438-Pyramimonas_sp.AAC.1